MKQIIVKRPSTINDIISIYNLTEKDIKEARKTSKKLFNKRLLAEMD